jgi:CheY-like chemotaxis protein
MTIFKNKVIMIVDDSMHMRMIVGQILRALPVKRTVEAAGSVEALERLHYEPVDAIIVDYRMEPLDGVEFVRMLRTAPDSPAPKVPILMMTGHTERSRVLAAREAGVTGFMAKPVSARLLTERLGMVIGNGSYKPPQQAAPPAPIEEDSEEDSYFLV